MLIGIPASQSKFHKFHRDVRIVYHTLLCAHSDYSSYERLGVNPLTNIVLGFNKKRIHSLNGNKSNFPLLNGMSGVPVFLFQDENGIISATETPIVGIFTTWPKQGPELLVTDVRQVLKFIEILNSSVG